VAGSVVAGWVQKRGMCGRAGAAWRVEFVAGSVEAGWAQKRGMCGRAGAAWLGESRRPLRRGLRLS
jgi:hypothetical protein